MCFATALLVCICDEDVRHRPRSFADVIYIPLLRATRITAASEHIDLHLVRSSEQAQTGSDANLAHEQHSKYGVVPGRLNGSSRFPRRGKKGVAIACQEGVHVADQGLHLAIAAACSVVDSNLPPCHLVQHCLKDSKLMWTLQTQGACSRQRDEQLVLCIAGWSCDVTSPKGWCADVSSLLVAF